jgi:hypothetical protein
VLIIGAGLLTGRNCAVNQPIKLCECGGDALVHVVVAVGGEVASEGDIALGGGAGGVFGVEGAGSMGGRKERSQP